MLISGKDVLLQTSVTIATRNLRLTGLSSLRKKEG